MLKRTSRTVFERTGSLSCGQRGRGCVRMNDCISISPSSLALILDGFPTSSLAVLYSRSPNGMDAEQMVLSIPIYKTWLIFHLCSRLILALMQPPPFVYLHMSLRGPLTFTPLPCLPLTAHNSNNAALRYASNQHIHLGLTYINFRSWSTWCNMAVLTVFPFAFDVSQPPLIDLHLLLHPLDAARFPTFSLASGGRP